MTSPASHIPGPARSTPGSSCSRSMASQITSSTTTADYVEDSEPERESRRLYGKSRRSKTRPKQRPPSPPAVEVIELTDSDSPGVSVNIASASVHHVRQPVVIIDVSGMFCFFSKQQLSIEVNATSDASKTPQEEAPSDVQVVVHQQPAQSNELYDDVDQDFTEDDSMPSLREILGLRRPPTAASAPSEHPSPQQCEEVQLQASSPGQLALSPTDERMESVAESEEEESTHRLKRGLSAFAAPGIVSRAVSTAASSVERVSEPPEALPKIAIKRSAPTHRFTEDFSEKELSQVLTCVSCELKWTARKSVAQKMKHIQTCAKKHGLTDDTVRTLLRKEVSSHPPATVASSSKRTSREPAQDPAPTTLLEEAVKDAKKKRQGKRAQVVQTIESVTDTRDKILDKARLLLKDTHNIPSTSTRNTTSTWTHMDMELPPLTQMFSRSTVTSRTSAPVQPADTTLHFGRSKLGGDVARVSTGIVHAGAMIAGQSDVTPATQVTRDDMRAAKSIGEEPDTGPPATQVSPHADDPPDDLISLHDTSSEHAPPSPPLRPLKRKTSPDYCESDGARPALPVSARSAFVEEPEGGVYDFDGWDDDEWDQGFDDDCGAHLRYDPEDGTAGPSRATSLTALQELERVARKGKGNAFSPEALNAAAPKKKPRGRPRKVANIVEVEVGAAESIATDKGKGKTKASRKGSWTPR
ncbi:uncharacterized protein BXZ73DRAFT_74348 [Epithele typhae]|uniref:uncharacterized protein n=1 Tax=Epithele typhae TaxID=378194 RepID=UPI002007414C|nr:uncharacterized protein BXZ73DRAFT_74348 [Epithele typhae]KAH9943382.1 hypothetical protein BXZ73DRAFT_74348 [Epithele typhae]